ERVVIFPCQQIRFCQASCQGIVRGFVVGIRQEGYRLLILTVADELIGRIAFGWFVGSTHLKQSCEDNEQKACSHCMYVYLISNRLFTGTEMMAVKHNGCKNNSLMCFQPVVTNTHANFHRNFKWEGILHLPFYHRLQGIHFSFIYIKQEFVM